MNSNLNVKLLGYHDALIIPVKRHQIKHYYYLSLDVKYAPTCNPTLYAFHKAQKDTLLSSYFNNIFYSNQSHG